MCFNRLENRLVPYLTLPYLTYLGWWMGAVSYRHEVDYDMMDTVR